MFRIILIILGLFLLLVVGAAILVPLLLDKDQVLALATETLERETGARLTVGGEIDLSIFPTLGISLGDASVTLPDREEPDLRVGALQIGVELMPLFSRQVQIEALQVSDLDIRVEAAAEAPAADTTRMSDAELEDFYLQRRRNRDAAGAAAGAEAALALPLALNVQQLAISNARIELQGAQGAPPTVLELLKLEAEGLNLDGDPIPLAVRLRVPGDSPLEVELDGRVTVRQDTQQAQFENLEIALRGATAEPLTLNASGTVDLSRQVAELDLSLQTGETRGSGTLRYASFESPGIAADLALNLLDPALFALAGPEAASAGEETPASGDEPLPLGALRNIDTQAKLSIERAIFGDHTLEDLQVELRALEGVINVSKLRGTLHGGRIEGTAVFNGRHNTATLNTRGTVADLDIATALAAGGSTTPITGRATLDWQLESRGRSVNELTAAMHGPIQLGTQEVILQGTSVEQLLCQAVALTNQERLTASFAPSTAFTSLGATVQVADGKAQLRPLRAELPHVKLTGTGNIDLLAQDFDATFKARLSPELEELDRACRVSKRLTAIDWPVNCRGALAADPASWCKVDSEKIIQDLAVNEGRRKLEKEAGKLLNKLFDKNRKKQEN
jgi:uncharacterized protein involved in outer membrane biogenesis